MCTRWALGEHWMRIDISYLLGRLSTFHGSIWPPQWSSYMLYSLTITPDNSNKHKGIGKSLLQIKYWLLLGKIQIPAQADWLSIGPQEMYFSKCPSFFNKMQLNQSFAPNPKMTRIYLDHLDIWIKKARCILYRSTRSWSPTCRHQHYFTSFLIAGECHSLQRRWQRIYIERVCTIVFQYRYFIWASCRLKSPVNRLFIQQSSNNNIKENINKIYTAHTVVSCLNPNND